MQAGDIDLRKKFYQIQSPPEWGEKEGWFHAISRATGISKSRVKSLYKDRRCRLWGSEAIRIERALLQVEQAQQQAIEKITKSHGETLGSQQQLNRVKEDIKRELFEDLRTLFVEWKHSADSNDSGDSGENLYSG